MAIHNLFPKIVGPLDTGATLVTPVALKGTPTLRLPLVCSPATPLEEHRLPVEAPYLLPSYIDGFGSGALHFPRAQSGRSCRTFHLRRNKTCQLVHGKEFVWFGGDFISALGYYFDSSLHVINDKLFGDNIFSKRNPAASGVARIPLLGPGMALTAWWYTGRIDVLQVTCISRVIAASK